MKRRCSRTAQTACPSGSQKSSPRRSGLTDLAIRYGGNGFLLLLTGATALEAQKTLASLGLRRLELETDDGSLAPFGMTWGTATWPGDGADLEHLLDAAERRLFGTTRAYRTDHARAWRQSPLSETSLPFAASGSAPCGPGRLLRAGGDRRGGLDHRVCARLNRVAACGVAARTAPGRRPRWSRGPDPSDRSLTSAPASVPLEPRVQPVRALDGHLTGPSVRHGAPAAGRPRLRAPPLSRGVGTAAALRGRAPRRRAGSTSGSCRRPRSPSLAPGRAVLYYGEFGSEQDAQALARRVRTAGYTAAIIGQ